MTHLENNINEAITEYCKTLTDQELDVLDNLDDQFLSDVLEYTLTTGEDITVDLFEGESRQQLDEIVPLLFGIGRAVMAGRKAYKAYKAGKKLKDARKVLSKSYNKGVDSVNKSKLYNFGNKNNPIGPISPKNIDRAFVNAPLALSTAGVGREGGTISGPYRVVHNPLNLHKKGISFAKNTANTVSSLLGKPPKPGTPTTIKPGSNKDNPNDDGRVKAPSFSLKKSKDIYSSSKKKNKGVFGVPLKNSYEFQVDVNENIIGATFAKGSNQGNFNNEVDAVRDALAQIQELSPQTISSYQKKAGKEYRQAKGERPMHPEYAAGLNAAGKMTDKDMDDNDKAYDKMKKRGRGLAMSKGKGVQKEENLNELKLGLRSKPRSPSKPLMPAIPGLRKIPKSRPKPSLPKLGLRKEDTQIDELAPLITSVLAAKAAGKVAKGVMKAAKGRTKFGPNKMGPAPRPSGPPSQPAKPSAPPVAGRAAPKPKLKGRGPKPLEGSRPSYGAGSTAPAPKRTYGPGNQMQSYDYGMEEGAMKELVTKKQEDERLAKRKKDSQYSDKEVRMGQGVAFDKRYKGGNMTGAYKTINKIKKGLGDHPKVADALRRANEEYNKGE